MKKEMFVGVLAMSLASTGAAADYKSDVAECNKQANQTVQDYRSSNATSQVIRGATNVIGSLLGGGSPGVAAGSAVRGYGYGVASDARMEAHRRDMAYKGCMRDKKMDALRQE